MKEINSGDVVIVMTNQELPEHISYKAGTSWRVYDQYTCECGNEYIGVGYHTELVQNCICGRHIVAKPHFLPKGNFVHIDDKAFAVQQLADDEGALKYLKPGNEVI